jgi:hypothetical protein
LPEYDGSDLPVVSVAHRLAKTSRVISASVGMLVLAWNLFFLGLIVWPSGEAHLGDLLHSATGWFSSNR